MSSDAHYVLIMFLSSCDLFQYIGGSFIHLADAHRPRSMVATLLSSSDGSMPRKTVVCRFGVGHHPVAPAPVPSPTPSPVQQHIDRGHGPFRGDMITLNKIRWLVLAIFHKLIRRIKRI